MHDTLDNTLTSWFRFYAATRLALASPLTIRQYDLNLRRFNEYLGHPATLDDLTDAKVMGCIGWLLREKKLSFGSVSKFRGCIKPLWEFVCRKGQRSVWPELPRVQVPRSIPIALSEANLVKLWNLMLCLPGDFDGIPASIYWRSFLATIWSTGERCGAMFQALPSDLDLEGGFFSARAETRKGGKESMVHPLHWGTVKILRQLVAYDRRSLWLSEVCDRTVYYHLGDLMKSIGLPDSRYYKFHVLRKSVATLTKVFGGDPSEVMGHKNKAIAEQCYVDPRIAPRDSAAKRLPWIFDQPGDDPKPAA